jgi:hypothetical protein
MFLQFCLHPANCRAPSWNSSWILDTHALLHLQFSIFKSVRHLKFNKSRVKYRSHFWPDLLFLTKAECAPPPPTRPNPPWRAQSMQSAKLFLQSSELGLPHPSPTGECAPPLWFRGVEAHSLRERGGGVPIPTRGHTLWYSIYIRTFVLRSKSTSCHLHGHNSSWPVR